MGHLLRVRYDCPQCGGSLELSEASRLLVCPFCGVRLAMVSLGAFRYTLPARIPDEIPMEDRFFIPYLRFRGPVLYCQGMTIRWRSLELSRCGIRAPGLPLSLGYRPQALRLAPAEVPPAKGRGPFYLRLRRKASEILTEAARIPAMTPADLPEDRDRQPIYHKTFIGEQVSIIYLPAFLKGEQLFDGITGDVLPVEDAARLMERLRQEPATSWQLKFIPALCPKCGWDMEAGRDSLLFSCPNCLSFWERRQAGLKPVRTGLLGNVDDGNQPFLLPFWQFESYVELQGRGLTSLYELFRFCGLPEGFGPRQERLERAAALMIPAFSSSPKVFLNLARAMTLAQGRMHTCEWGAGEGMSPISDGGSVKVKFMDVSISRQDAQRTLKMALGAMSLSKKRLFPLLRELKIGIRDTRLCYVPFYRRGSELVQEEASAAVSLKRVANWN